MTLLVCRGHSGVDLKFADCGKFVRRLTGLLLGLLICHGAVALDRDLGIGQFHHTSWTAKDGAPIGTRSMEQTPDGWLWLGGPGGLYRFDGIRFERFQPLSGEEFATTSVSRIEAGPDGELWIGLMSGGVSRLKDGHLTHYGPKDGLDAVSPTMIRAALDGAVWATTGSALFRFDGKRWERVGADWNLNMKVFNGISVDGRGTLWLSHSEGVEYLRKGSRRFETGAPSDSDDMLGGQVIDGVIWKVGRKKVWRVPDVGAGAGAGALAASAPLSSSAYRRHQSSALIDRDLNLWTVYCPAGLCRTRLPRQLVGEVVQLPPVEETFKASDGLSGDSGMMVLEDQEGSIWVATNTGLDRFRRSKLTPVALPTMVTNFALIAAPGNAVWVAGYTPQPPGMWAVDRRAVAMESPEKWMRAAYRSAEGRMWFGGPEGLWEWSGSRFIDIVRPPLMAHHSVLTMASDATGLWVAFANGLLRLQDGLWSEAQAWGLPREPVSALAVDRSGTAWFGFGDGRIRSLAAGKVRTFDAKDGLDVGAVVLLHAGKTVYAAGDSRVDVLIDSRFHRLSSLDQEALAGVSGIVDTAAGDLWLNGRKGAVHIDATELARFIADPGHVVRSELFDIQDGYPGIANVRYPQPSAVAGADGRLWFAGVTGVAWLDPRRLEPAAPPARPAVLGMFAAGTSYPADDGVELPQRTNSVQFRYTAPGMGIPERARFRYRLDGVDNDWREPEATRETGYNNLSPGAYRFSVIAANEDGAWSANAASLAFSIKPTPFQTVWFKTLCVLVALLMMWLLYQLRVRQLTRHAREKMQERLVERERIARELHDTLLQGIHGLILRFQVATERIPLDDPARTSMEGALQRADKVLLEGRDRVADLREHTEHANELHQALSEVGEELSRDYSSDFRMTIDGTPRDLHPVAHEEIRGIATEALLNAFRHAKAHRVELALRYGYRDMRVRVHDDGLGIEADILERGRQGHWGLSGMRERAKRIGGVLTFHSAPGDGTRVELRLSSRLAYKNRSMFDGWRQFWRRATSSRP